MNLLDHMGFIPNLIRGKNPEDAAKTALTDAAILSAGMYAMPFFGASAPAGTAALAPVESAIGANVAGEAVAANAMPSAAAGQVGVYGAAPAQSGILGTAGDMAKTGYNALGAANMAKNMFQPQQQPIQPSPTIQSMPNNSIGQLVQQAEQSRMAQSQSDMAMRSKRQQQIAGIGNRSLLG